MPVINAKSVDPDQMPHPAAGLPMSHLWDTRHKWVNMYIFQQPGLLPESTLSDIHPTVLDTLQCSKIDTDFEKILVRSVHP